MAQHLIEQLDAHVGHDPVAHPLHKDGVAVGAQAAHAHDQGNQKTGQEDGIDFRARIQEGRVFRELLRSARTAALENGASHFADDQRYAAIGDAESEAEGEAEGKAQAVRLYIRVEPLVRPPAGAKGRPKGGLSRCGLRFTHRAGAAGADSRAFIASITDFVEIWFIATARCLGLNSVTGPSVSPSKMAADSEQGCQWKGLVGPKRTTCGVSKAAAKCIGAESTVTRSRARRTSAAR